MERVLGLIGNGPMTADLMAHGAPLAGWSALVCAPLDGSRDEIARVAGALGGACLEHGQEVVRAADAVLVLGSGPRRVKMVESVLREGRPVLAPSLVEAGAEAISQLQALSLENGAAFLPLGELASLSLSSEARARVAQPEFGKLHSIYAAARMARKTGPGDFRRLRWEMIHLALQIARQRPCRLHVTPGTMGGQAWPTTPDVEVILLRFADDLIATIEVAACLPVGSPRCRLLQIELEAIGARRAVRLEPTQTVVRLESEGWFSPMPFTDPAIIPMLAQLQQAVAFSHPAVAEGAYDTARVMDCADRSLREGRPILLD